MTEKPVFIEYNVDDEGRTYATEWYVPPVPPEVPFTVRRDEWTEAEGIRVHRIFEVALT